jgi:hypothetical protein
MIPKVIYICHKTLDDIQKYSLAWTRLNPEYKIELYDDDRCKSFLLNEYSQLHVDIFDFIPDGPIKCDFWRVCVLFKFGGVYADADIQPLVPLSSYIEDNDDFVTCLSHYFPRHPKFNPHFIVSQSGNIFLEKAIATYVDFFKQKHQYSYWGWSICCILDIQAVKRFDSHVLYINGMKCKMLKEIKVPFNDKNDFCIYNNIIVMKNRYDNYRDHNFIPS